VLRNNFIAVMMGISTMSFVVLTIISSHAFAQNDCSVQDNAACAQSDLSLPVPSENDIAAPGLQQQPGDQSRDADGDSSGEDEESEDNDINHDGSTFLLPFP
jgi:hypothetical protein